MRRTDHSSRGVLPTVARRVCDLENLVNEEAIASVGLQRYVKKNYNLMGPPTYMNSVVDRNVVINIRIL
jgi:hypothetical protein